MLTRSGVAKRLGKSIATVRRMEGIELHPQRDARGVHRFSAHEVECVASGRGDDASKRHRVAGLAALKREPFALAEPPWAPGDHEELSEPSDHFSVPWNSQFQPSAASSTQSDLAARLAEAERRLDSMKALKEDEEDVEARVGKAVLAIETLALVESCSSWELAAIEDDLDEIMEVLGDDD